MASLPLEHRHPVGTVYRTYKQATDELAGWLASTAEPHLDYDSRWSDDSAQEQGELKYALRISQFRRYTDVIVEATPRIEVPLDIIETARKAYETRLEKADLLRDMSVESDQGHLHVISIIEDVYKKLRDHRRCSIMHRKKVTTPSVKDSKDSSPKMPLSPSFQLLDLEPMESD